MRILHITYGFDGGGVGYVIANYCANEALPGIHFDIIGDDLGHNQLLHERFEQAGFHVYYVTPKKKSLLKNIRDVFRIIKDGGYDAVHVHFEEWSFLYLLIARLCKVPVRICHAHTAHMIGADKKIHYRLFRFLLNRFATIRIACSKDAGDHLYGKLPYVILHNAFETERYKYNDQTRQKMRRALGVENCFVMGVVGRLAFPKNPEFTVDIFAEGKKLNNKAALLFIGRGALEEQVKKKVSELNLSDSVLFLGHRDDVPELLQAMDVFVLPSQFEGLGMVYVEAQAAGLRTFATADVVPIEACLSTELFTYIPQSATAMQWAEKIISADTTNRIDTSDLVRTKGYDISIERKKLEKLYYSSFGDNNGSLSK